MRRTGERVRRAATNALKLTEAEGRQRALERVDRITEPFLLLMAFAMVPLILGPFLWELSGTERRTFAALSTVVWVAFAVDFGAKLLISLDRRAYLRSHWLEAAIVLAPMFRPLYLIRFALFGSRALLGMRRLAEIDFVLVLSAGVVIVGATVMFSVGTTPNIDSFGDALWFAIVTVTTVGYGDIFPVTMAGRIVAFFVMFAGIALFGAVAGNVAALLARAGRRSSNASGTTLDDLMAEIQGLKQQLSAVERSVGSGRTG